MHLEHALGTRLLDRNVRTLRLTAEGTTLHLRTRGLIAEITEAGEAIRGGLARPRGQLRVCSPSLLAELSMGRLAAEFCRKYPDVVLEVVADDRTAARRGGRSGGHRWRLKLPPRTYPSALIDRDTYWSDSRRRRVAP